MKFMKLSAYGVLARYMQVKEEHKGTFTISRDNFSIQVAAAGVTAVDKSTYTVRLAFVPSLRGRKRLVLEVNPLLATVGSVANLTFLSEEDAVEIYLRSASPKVEEAVQALTWVARFSLLEV